jgi:hypothetical protein
MNKEENVYEEEKQMTEDSARAQTGEMEASAALKKFKDVNALLKAYESLQSEFTRRSQRLKELERRADNQGQVCDESDSGVEKLRKNAQKKREERKAFERFLTETEEASAVATPENGPAAWEELQTGSGQTEADKVEEEKENAIKLRGEGGEPVAEFKNSLSSEELYLETQKNEEVRLRIIGEYLRSVGRALPPLTVGGKTAVTPPLKPRDIKDAGQMALKYFKNSTAK